MTNNDFCVNMMEKIFDIKEQMTNLQYKTLVELVAKRYSEGDIVRNISSYALTINILVPELSYDGDGGSVVGWRDENFITTEVLYDNEFAVLEEKMRIQWDDYRERATCLINTRNLLLLLHENIIRNEPYFASKELILRANVISMEKLS